MYLTRRVEFFSAHSYRLRDLSDEENRRLFGPCANPFGHGHNYTCEVTLRGDIDPRTGMVINIKELDRRLKEEVVSAFDHKFIDKEHPAFERRIPTLENLSLYIWNALVPGVGGAGLSRVVLWENSNLYAECVAVKEKPVVFLTRIYDFAASHRLHSHRLSDEENRAVFGKCNNPNGHGHNYGLEITWAGEVDARTGMIGNLPDLDRIVEEEVLERYDHKNLNLDCPEFSHINPTSENLTRAIWERLA
ncbi:MAG: 6-carboxytetrahydropterin synthase, partial [Armatimonadetes bacterium]|nr:6-carboxytetrahydropterin synthase [Armatimonadota bacterium]